MKVNVDIAALERKIAMQWYLGLFGGGYTEDQQYHKGCGDAYLDILCGYLGITETKDQRDLEEKCYNKWKNVVSDEIDQDLKQDEIDHAWQQHNAKKG